MRQEVNTPLVSVVIPNFNHARYLDERITSVLNQTYKKIEVIILDDCSDDESVSIIEKYRNEEKVAHIIIFDTNSGSTFRQWQKGVRLAKGEWIWIAESDDYCEPTLLENLMKGQQPQCTLAFCQSITFDSDGIIRGVTSFPVLNSTLKGKEFVDQYMLFWNKITNASMCIFRKEAFLKVDDSFMNYSFCGDWLLWVQIALQGEVYICGKVLNYFRKHSNDVSGRAYRNGLFYTEYFTLLNDFVNRNIITHRQKQSLLQQRFKQLLNDTSIGELQKKQVTIQFHSKLGRIVNLMIFQYELILLKQKAVCLAGKSRKSVERLFFNS